MAVDIEPGFTIVQINPAHDPVWGGALLVVTEVEAWGVVGYTLIPALGGPDPSFYRASAGQYAVVGRARWRMA